MSLNVIYPATIYARMKSHLHDTVPFPLLLLLPQWIIHNEKEKIIKDMSKTTTTTEINRITNAITHPAVICASAPGIVTASHLPMLSHSVSFNSRASRHISTGDYIHLVWQLSL